MKKKILSLGIIAILIVMLFALTGCGNDDSQKGKQEYTEAIMELRNYTVGVLDGNTVGEILDVALEDASWKENTNYSISSGAVIVKGKDKNSGDEVEIVWLTTVESGRVGFEKMTKGDENIGYSAFLTYLQGYID